MRIFNTLFQKLCIKKRSSLELPYPEPYTVPITYAPEPCTMAEILPEPQKSPAFSNSSASLTFDTLPLLFKQDRDRFTHYSDTSLVMSEPAPTVILPFSKATEITTPEYAQRNIALLVKPKQLSRAVKSLFMWENSIKAVIISMEADMLLSHIRRHEYFILQQWCFQRHIQLGAYMYQSTEHLYVPYPQFDKHASTAFQFYILDTAVADKYSSIKYIMQYLMRVGVDVRTLIPLYIPDAPIQIQQYNCGGYFFREDMCQASVQRNTIRSIDLPFELV